MWEWLDVVLSLKVLCLIIWIMLLKVGWVGVGGVGDFLLIWIVFFFWVLLKIEVFICIE